MESCEPADEEELPIFSLGMEFLTTQKERKGKENKEQARPVSSRFATLSESKFPNIYTIKVCLKYSLLHTGLEISTRKLAKCKWFFEVASLKNILWQTFAS